MSAELPAEWEDPDSRPTAGDPTLTVEILEGETVLADLDVPTWISCTVSALDVIEHDVEERQGDL